MEPESKKIGVLYVLHGGMDTYKPSRWADLPEIAEESRDWLHQLPPDAATLIARGNVERLFLRTQ